jgi:Protein of unknown function (DUF2586)
MTTGDVELTILDGGAGVVVVPSSSIQVVIGTCSGGTVSQVVATRNANTLQGAVGYGPAVDAAAMSIAAGGTVLFIKAATGTAGAASAVTAFSTGTSVVTVTGNPYDAYLVKMLVTAGGTRGTAGIRFKISLDAGRTYGLEISLGTAVTYVIPNTGLTLAFATGTMVAGESVTFGCTEPLCTASAVVTALAALEASPYSSTGWGSLHIVGTRDSTAIGTIKTQLETMATAKTFTRAIVSLRDNALPTAYGGAGETDATWSAAIALDMSAVDAKRFCAVGGHYNMASAFPVLGTAPVMRRPGAFALAARQVAIAPQTHAGRVSDGAIAQIIVDPVNDPTDGFNYHDEHNAPALDVARITSFRKRKGKGGMFVVNPKLLSGAGSVFTMLPLGNVMDIGCSLLNQENSKYINSDIKLNTNGTIDEREAQRIEAAVRGVLRDQMLAKSMISDFAYAIDRSTNIRTTSTVVFAATLYARGYVLEIDGTVGLA